MHTYPAALAGLLTLAACAPAETTTDSREDVATECPELQADAPSDADGDGYTAAIDCDDADPDAGAPAPLWLDADGDGYGDSAHPLNGCLPASSGASNGSDCDDMDARAHPASIWYADDDGDGYGDPLAWVSSCVQPFGTVATPDDCDDGDDGTHPGAAELCDGIDQDCDGYADNGAELTTWHPDADGDGYGSEDPALAVSACDPAEVVGDPAGWVADGSDCDDARPDVYPGAPGSWNGDDLSCSGS